MKNQARITSKGQITVPRDIRRALRVRAGDRLLFELDGAGARIRPIRTSSPFAKFQGIAGPGWPAGRKAILRRIRQMRDS